MNRIITPEEEYPILPENIDASQHLWSAFDHSETETSAGWLVRFAQERGTGWAPFTREEIDAFYNRKYPGHFGFNRLVNPESVLADPAKEFGKMAEHANLCRNTDPVGAALSYAISRASNPPEVKGVGGGWIVRGEDGRFWFTHDFISRCFRSSPTAPKVALPA